MYLTNAEYEAFARGQAAGLIPMELPPPADEQAEQELIFHIGVMVSAKIGYRNLEGRLRTMELSSFTDEYLNTVIRRLPELKSQEVRATTSLRLTVYPTMLQGLCNYFSFGPAIVSAEDLAGRLSLHDIKLFTSQILKGFTLNYVPVVRTGLATLRQRAVLTEMILEKRLPTITRRQWENMTIAEATKLISSAPKPQAELPGSVATVLSAFGELPPEERTLLRHLINRNPKGQLTA